jgi:hypothetical protein
VAGGGARATKINGFWFDGTNFPCAQDTGSENLYIGPKNVFKASAGGRLGHQAADHPWSALRVVKAAEKTAPTAKMLPKPKQ